MSIIDLAVLILVASLFILTYLMKVDPRFPILVSIAFLLASAVFYYWDPTPWAVLAFYSFITGLVIIVIERLRPTLMKKKKLEESTTPFFGKLDKVIRSKKRKGKTGPETRH